MQATSLFSAGFWMRILTLTKVDWVGFCDYKTGDYPSRKPMRGKRISKHSVDACVTPLV